MSDWSKRVADRIDLEMRKERDAREQQRVAALDEAHLKDLGSTNWVKNVERRVSNALLEEQIEATARKEERLLAEDLERNQ